jgi:hypothetical protein
MKILIAVAFSLFSKNLGAQIISLDSIYLKIGPVSFDNTYKDSTKKKYRFFIFKSVLGKRYKICKPISYEPDKNIFYYKKQRIGLSTYINERTVDSLNISGLIKDFEKGDTFILYNFKLNSETTLENLLENDNMKQLILKTFNSYFNLPILSFSQISFYTNNIIVNLHFDFNNKKLKRIHLILL